MARPMSKSLYDWCIENDREDILQLWDYELNCCSPDEVGYGTAKKYWFKCPRGIHNSEQKSLNLLTNEKMKLTCKQCNSFGQWVIDTFGEDALEKYWDYRMNKVNPFEISKCSDKKVWIFCQEVDYHGSYDISCSHFYSGKRCSYCGNHKIHLKDSLGQKLIDNYGKDAIEKYWSKKNKISPFDVAPYSMKKYWFICQNDEEHEDYEMKASNFSCGQRCPECKESKGERKIREILNNYNINFIPQKTFPNLLGINNGSLRYDFYILEQNLLIEYQGEQHYNPQDFKNDGIKKAEENFKIQQEHDRRKREYAEEHRVKLLEIPYWDFDNIETIINENIK